MGSNKLEMNSKQYGFIWGMQVFSRSFARVWIVPELRKWFFKTLLVTIFLALLIIVSLFATGAWAFASYFENAWTSAAAVLLWTLALFFISGHLSLLLMSVLVLLIGGESALTKYYFSQITNDSSLSFKDKVRQQLKDRSGEIYSMLKSLAVALIAWPLLIFPLTMPLGVLVFAWAMAGDALAVSRRICHEKGCLALQDNHKLSASTQMGMALLPASLALVPVVGWALLPILQVAGLEAQLSQGNHLKNLPMTKVRGEVPKV